MTKLMWALGQYSDTSEIYNVMRMNLVGEMGLPMVDWSAGQ